MHILVIGAGTIGASIAEMLCAHRHSVVFIEKDPEVGEELDAKIDALYIPGNAALSSVLFQAGALRADLCIAATGSDETNLLAASIAKSMGTRRVAARISTAEFADSSTFDYRFHLKIDRLISIKQLTALEIARRIREPGAMIIENFARGKLEMQDVVITDSSGVTGVPLCDVRFSSEVRIGTINRNGNVWIANAADKLEPGDRISLFGPQESVEKSKTLFSIQQSKKRSVLIAGGGETGMNLASILLNRKYNVTVFETNSQRCEFIASKMRNLTVVNRDSRRRYDLEEERAGEYDYFIACTGDDENNIVASVEASVLGAKHILAVIGRPDYANVIERVGIHDAVSPRDVVGRQILGLLNTGAMIYRNSYILGGGIDVLEMEVHPNSVMTSAPLKEITLPPQCIIAAVFGEGYVQVPTAKHRFLPGDTVVALVHASSVQAFTKLFVS